VSTATERLVAFASQLSVESVPNSVANAAKLHMLDTLGCGLAALGMEKGTEGANLVLEQGGKEEATVIGGAASVPAASAALANGILCHALDFDDTHAGAIAHVSTVVVPAAVAAAEACGRNGADTLAAIVAGNETVIRVGMAAPGLFHERGFHPTSVCGVFGATLAAGMLWGITESQLVGALGIAGSMASGIFEYLADGSQTKPLHAGWAAHAAITAAQLAKRGARGPSTVLEGRFGLYAAYLGLGSEELERQLSDLGERWETPKIAYKAYPACHYIHGCLGALREILDSKPVSAEDVQEISITVPNDAVRLVLEPIAAKKAPRTEYEAKFSLPYSLGAMLVNGRVGLDSYRRSAIDDARALRLAALVTYEVVDYATCPGAFPGGIKLVTRDGTVLTNRHEYQKGAPENPLTEAEIREKYRLNAAAVLSSDDIEALERDVVTLEAQQSVRSLAAPLSRAATA